ncbi:MAG: FxsA family protein, partial [Planctomycetes bacterium]|nr:FxsA family protein [Planctomycetota bacterium]
MLARLLFLFIVVPLIELTLLLLLARVTTIEFTLLLVLATGALGALLARQQGLAAFRRIREDIRQGRAPAGSVVDAVLILIAGALLLTPGVLTDAFGLSLLCPPFRRRYKAWMLHWIHSRFRIRTGGAGKPPGRTE